jgi:hypothetical protein
MPAGNFTVPGCVSLIRWLGGIETPRLNVTRVPPRSSPEVWGHIFIGGDTSPAKLNTRHKGAFIATRPSPLAMLYNLAMPEPSQIRLERVLGQLRLYQHPLLDFSARAKGDGVEIIIEFKDKAVPVHTYYFDMHPRDLDDPQFEWSFQRQLYDALHDYFVEMFIRTPQDRADRQRNGL